MAISCSNTLQASSAIFGGLIVASFVVERMLMVAEANYYNGNSSNSTNFGEAARFPPAKGRSRLSG
jgi:hypothetical protein